MLKEKIEKAENNVPKRGGFNAIINGTMIAVLRDKDGNIKDYREVEL